MPDPYKGSYQYQEIFMSAASLGLDSVAKCDSLYKINEDNSDIDYLR